MFCYKCGKKLDKDMSFCPYCGTEAIKQKQQNEYETIKNKEEKQIDSSINLNVEKSDINAKSKKRESANYKKIFGKIGFFIYDFREIIISVFSLILIFLFFCNYFKIDILGVEVISVNGFQGIKYLFNGDFFDNISLEEFDISNVTLFQLAYLIYFIMLVMLILLILNNLVSFIKKKNNTNTKNLVNYVLIFILTIIQIVLYYSIKDECSKIIGNVLTLSYSSSIIALMVVCIIPLTLSIVCRFCKLNNTSLKQEIKNNFKYSWKYIIVLNIFLLCFCFINLTCLSNTETSSDSIFSLMKNLFKNGTIGVGCLIYFISIFLGIFNVLLCLITKNVKDLNINNLFNQFSNFILMLAIYILLRDELEYSIVSFYLLNLLIIIISLIYSVVCLRLLKNNSEKSYISVKTIKIEVRIIVYLPIILSAITEIEIYFGFLGISIIICQIINMIKEITRIIKLI